ncbi:MAG: bacillithiol system redox-active protein YtxJ [Flavobacteriales bacterium]|nr:bacillithiol system redox-active protein YtxJ [Flavobacteriales bacterium]
MPCPGACPTFGSMDWIPLTTLAQLDEVDAASRHKPVLIFKHSTRCNISSGALNRLERAWTPSDDAAQTIFHLDLLAHRDISNAIAERYGVEHESPQVLVIRDGKCVHVAAHLGITYADTLDALAY